MISHDKTFLDSTNASGFTFTMPNYKYSVEFKELNMIFQFENMTFMQKLFAKWFLSGKITKI
jgi:hypothetical protein